MTPYSSGSGSLVWRSLWQQLGESLIKAAAQLIGARPTIVMGPTRSSPKIFTYMHVSQIECAGNSHILMSHVARFFIWKEVLVYNYIITKDIHDSTPTSGV